VCSASGSCCTHVPCTASCVVCSVAPTCRALHHASCALLPVPVAPTCRALHHASCALLHPRAVHCIMRRVLCCTHVPCTASCVVCSASGSCCTHVPCTASCVVCSAPLALAPHARSLLVYSSSSPARWWRVATPSRERTRLLLTPRLLLTFSYGGDPSGPLLALPPAAQLHSRLTRPVSSYQMSSYQGPR
jgi:hypothetical protein